MKRSCVSNHPITLLPTMVALLCFIGCREKATIPSRTTLAPSFADAARLRDHWVKHRNEFEPGMTEMRYLAKARSFFADRSAEIESKTRTNGDELRYRPRTNEFGVLSDEGVIRTYFRPSTGAVYWERQ